MPCEISTCRFWKVKTCQINRKETAKTNCHGNIDFAPWDVFDWTLHFYISTCLLCEKHPMLRVNLKPSQVPPHMTGTENPHALWSMYRELGDLIVWNQTYVPNKWWWLMVIYLQICLFDAWNKVLNKNPKWWWIMVMYHGTIHKKNKMSFDMSWGNSRCSFLSERDFWRFSAIEENTTLNGLPRCCKFIKLLGLSFGFVPLKTINKLHFVSETNLHMQLHDYKMLQILIYWTYRVWHGQYKVFLWNKIARNISKRLSMLGGNRLVIRNKSTTKKQNTTATTATTNNNKTNNTNNTNNNNTTTTTNNNNNNNVFFPSSLTAPSNSWTLKCWDLSAPQQTGVWISRKKTHG